MKKILICVFLLSFFHSARPMQTLDGFINQDSLAFLSMTSDTVESVARLWQFLEMGISLEVDFSNHNLTGFKDDFFFKLNGVVIFNLSDNKIRRLPESIASVKTLKRLDVSGNPLENTKEMKTLRSQLVAKGVQLIGWEE